MDREVSMREAARRLGTSAPRVRRALDRMGRRHEGGGVTDDEFSRLRAELGIRGRVPGLSGSQARVLAALARAPLGLVSARAVAARAGVAPTSASVALGALAARGLVHREPVELVSGRATVWRADPLATGMGGLAPSLRRIRPPRASRGRPARRIPRDLVHLFWGGDPRRIELPRDGAFVARRLLESPDTEAIAWGRAHLNRTAWARAARLRGLATPEHALARRLARPP